MRKTTRSQTGATRFRVGVVALLAGCMTVLLVAGARPPAQALPDYLTQFNEKYGTSGSRLDDCSTCHTEVPDAEHLNPYGTDFGAANHDFAAIEQMDSDGDGTTNIDEIKALTFPGDPNDHP